MALTHKQEIFCVEYAKTGNGAAAVKAAGYKAGTANSAGARASQLLKDVNVQNRLKELYDMAANESIASIQEIKEFWTRVMRNEETEEVVLGAEGGPYRLSKDCSLRDRLKAAELLGKTAGLFIDKLQVEGNVPVIISGDTELEE